MLALGMGRDVPDGKHEIFQAGRDVRECRIAH